MEFEEEFDITIPDEEAEKIQTVGQAITVHRGTHEVMPRRVVITGLGVVTALGTTLESFWSGLCEGRSGVAPLTLFDTTDFKVHFGGQVHGWDPEARFGVKEARRLDRFAQFALAAAEAAVDALGDRLRGAARPRRAAC